MKLLQFVLVLFLVMSAASADVVISEIMYDPTQGSDTDLEWIEIHNNGSTAVDVSSWTFDGSNFDDVTINPNEYIVIARELIDGTDNDTESFEAYYGNNDGVWDANDGNYRVVDGTMSLLSGDYIVLTDGSYADAINYSASWGGNGNGKSIHKIDLNGANVQENWAESIFDGGTPGKNKNNNGVLISLNVMGLPKNITSVSLPDDLTEIGYQIIPSAGLARPIPITVEIDASSTLNVYAELNNTKIQLNETFSNGTIKTFSGNLQMQFYDAPGNYSINISATDQNQATIYRLVEFDYVPLVSSMVDVEEVNFGEFVVGSSSERNVTVKNAGNVAIDLTLASTDLTSGQGSIPASSLNVKSGSSYVPLSSVPVSLDLNLMPNAESNGQLYFQVNVPSNASLDRYVGVVSLVAVGN